ncbi:MAG: error-prone DNA polymerase [Ancrocorticia sp.]|jgi:error-prone DNA polymerase|nr:error-prone DNA polymerase [Ancrocorticia sp.]MCI1932113.1 error-prone DNA polymerase [Ancrocorticia sp.]MCI1963473.1 error-prone DNA polymerase [Ancrocorticia sp.]MCI2002333.1 error-prone DNA polymerase [Ancrocorticia sp.]MCI2012685.1 error-prone DNA polymerase [Ancrocorticia sp.]
MSSTNSARHTVPYAELHVHSAYSFLDGASLPEELVSRACELELTALAITDHGGFPGAMQMATAAREVGMPTVIGTELTLDSTGEREGIPDPEGNHLVLLARGKEGYSALSHAIGAAMIASGVKNQACYTLEELGDISKGRWVALTGCRKGAVRRALEKEPRWGIAAARREVDRLVAAFGRDNVAVELTITGDPLDRERCEILSGIARAAQVRAITTGNVHYARPADRPVADVLAATRAHRTLNHIDPYLPASGNYLRSGQQMADLHADNPRAVRAAAELGEECAFDMALVAPQLPPFPVPSGYTEATWLRALTERRARERYGSREENPHAWAVIDHELDVIIELDFPGYFLIVEEIVSFCSSHGIWCQGRGSAANSAVCYALGITPVDAVRHSMLFERFLSPERVGPPDIDIDIESGRREEVVQHVYARYGRTYAAQVANAITYRPRSAIRDAARALGYDSGQADRWATSVEHTVPRKKGRTSDPTKERRYAEEAAYERSASFSARWDTRGVPSDVATIASRMQRLPRHLGIHSGGMVLCDRPVIDVCPVSWASKPGRTVLQWDKDDCAEAGLVKFDLLGLGMLTALRISFTALNERGIVGERGKPLGLHNLPQEDPRVYRLLQAADTVGVFQVESRAQMATLPSLRPHEFYDIVIEVALIRPGPIQGQSVNPFLRRKNGLEKVEYLHPLVRPALEKTLGVPLFQEQLMRIAMDAAGFSPAQADRLRKAMGAKRSHERIDALRTELFEGMAQNGIPQDKAEKIFEQLHAFAEFGFPESHAFSFAYLVYASAWLKVHYPEEFYAGLLAAQPMGFYSPQSLVADARRHGVLVLPPDVTVSDEDARALDAPQRLLTPHPLVDVNPHRAVQLGLMSVKGIGKAGSRIIAARNEHPFANVADVAYRAHLSQEEIEALAAAGAFESLGMNRRKGMWVAASLADRTKVLAAPSPGISWYQPTIPGTETQGDVPALPVLTDAEETDLEIRSTGVSTAGYPTEFVRPQLNERGVTRIADLAEAKEGIRMKVAGIVTHRQRPHTAKGVTFLSLEDETGLLNVVCSHGLWQRYRTIARRSSALIVRGMVERGDGAMNFVADALAVLPLHVSLPSRDFR